MSTPSQQNRSSKDHARQSTIGPLLESVSRKPKFLRFPYNHTGDSEEEHDTIAAFLSAHGYRLAPCTIDNTDYKFDETYVLALARHDGQAAAKVRADYIAYTGAEIDWYTALDKQVFGYDPPHVMLLHDSPLNGDTIEQSHLAFQAAWLQFCHVDGSPARPRVLGSGNIYHQVRTHVGIPLGAGTPMCG